MPLVYAAADLFAFSSLTDTQGLVLTEAKAAGLPAVCVDSFGPATVVKDGVDGFLVPNDPDAFAAAVLRVLREPELRGHMREAALERAPLYSIEATAAAYEAVYEEALAEL
jgi:glycosyltransferase involved in cell wall biosynthesis